MLIRAMNLFTIVHTFAHCPGLSCEKVTTISYNEFLRNREGFKHLFLHNLITREIFEESDSTNFMTQSMNGPTCLISNETFMTQNNFTCVLSGDLLAIKISYSKHDCLRLM